MTMPRFVEGVPRTQSTLFPERLEDYLDEENPVRAIDAFVDAQEPSSTWNHNSFAAAPQIAGIADLHSWVFTRSGQISVIELAGQLEF